ncbi:TIGR03826 family flagellar region protein [Aneurinibacillus tyrosinisolvens]|uniref:TIGR03826 family flagellar region protein n=1 Tax=Aneurinibacillus tyrosinisolvens TaxID=1443435 RepID=UPI00063F6478|nr:TIGR03826 family flagellar region protein [Aneurinibacillus tyrosinisolvens]
MSLNVENCPRCGNLFKKIRQPVCPNCVKAIDEEYEKCYKYLRKKENRSCNIQELSEATGVPTKQIARFIIEKRLSVDNNPNMGYFCKSCGTTIREGTLCGKCSDNIKKQIGHLHEDEQRREALREEGKEKGAFYRVSHDE